MDRSASWHMCLLSAMALLALAHLAAFAQRGVELQTATEQHGMVSVLDFGADRKGAKNCTAAFQAAIDAAAETGGAVDVPPGKYLVGGSLEVKECVAIRGSNPAPMSIRPLEGAVILATGGRDDEAAPPLFDMRTAASVQGVTVYYPDQKPDDIHAYPWTFHLSGDDCTIENVTLINSYNGIKTGPSRTPASPSTVRHRIRSVVGCVLRRGIFVDHCTDIGRIENVQFHNHWWSHPDTGGSWAPVWDYMAKNLEAFVFGRTDWEYVTNCFVFPAKTGYRFTETAHGLSNGHLTACGADQTQTAVLVEKAQTMGWLITAGQFVSQPGEDPVHVRIAESNESAIRFVNCSFWGPSKRIAHIQGDGHISFDNCTFDDWRGESSDVALILVDSGRIQIANCSFTIPPPCREAFHPSIELGPNVAHAIIQGNNGRHGVHIIDNSAGKAILVNNEPPGPATP